MGFFYNTHNNKSSREELGQDNWRKYLLLSILENDESDVFVSRSGVCRTLLLIPSVP